MGLALEELGKDDQPIAKDNDISVLVEERVRNYLEIVPAIILNYKEGPFDSGFVFEGASTC